MNAALALVFLLGLAGPASAAEQYKIDPAHTSIYFRVSHFGLSEVYGRFNEFKGDFTLGEKPRFRLAVRAESIDTGIEKRDEHLRGPDFFNVKQYPVISFESQSVERKGERFHVTGNLTLHGVTKQVTLELEKNGEGEGPQGKYRAGFSTKHTLKRSGYGMDYMVGPVGDEVTLMISFEGIRQ
jgi:polyisoprenoid-binding protein YceI